MFYKFFNINGTVFPIAVNISGHGAPTASTEGAVDMLYRNVDDNSVYQCTAALNGIYIWEPFSVFNKDNITLGLHTDGLIYIFIDGTPVGNGIALPGGGQSGDVIGNVDSGNNIVLNGDLADGTYTVKYEMEDGSTIDIGELVLDTNVYYSVTNNLTNCTNSNNATSAVKGESYNATITANDGYELSSVVVTMGGTDITSSVVSGGNISIANVTGNIVITAVAEEIAEPTNFADPSSADWVANGRIRSSGAIATDVSGADAGRTFASNFVECQKGDVVEITGGLITAFFFGFYDSSKNKLQALGWGDAKTNSYVIDASNSSSGATFTVNVDNTAFMRFTLSNVSDQNAVIINVKRNGEYL